MPDFHDTLPALNRNRHLTQTRLGLLMLVTFVIALGLTPIIRVEGQSESTPTPAASPLGMLEPQLAEAWDRLALIYADLSRQQLEQGYVNNALHLALESLAHYDQGIYRPESSRALVNALDYPLREVKYLQNEDHIDDARWNRDGSKIMTRYANRVRLWDAATHEQILMLRHIESVGGAIWNRDETQILSWGFTGFVNTWDTRTGEKLLDLANEGYVSVIGATWNRDETRILSWTAAVPNDTGQVGNDLGDIIIWDAITGEVMLKIHQEASIRSVAWSSDETRLLSWDRQANLHVWDATTGESLFNPDYYAEGAAWSQDSSRILGYGDENNAVIWDAVTGERLVTFQHEGQVTGAGWSADHTHILTWSSDMMVRVWDARSGEIVLEHRHDVRIRGAAWNSDESWLVSWSDDGFVRIRSTNGNVESQYIEYDVPVMATEWSADGTRLLVWLSDNSVHLWDTVNAQEIGMIRHPRRVEGIDWHPDGQTFMTHASESLLQFWAETTFVPTFRIDHGAKNIGAVWLQDTPFVIFWTESGEVWQTDVTTGESTNLLRLEDFPKIWLVRLSPDGSRFFTAHRNNMLYVWDTTTQEQVAALMHDEMTVIEAAWNADGTRLLSWSDADRNNCCWLWDIETQTPIVKISLLDDIRLANWSHNGQRIVAFENNEIFVLSAVTGELIHTFGHEDFVGGATWSADDSKILSWGRDFAVRVWDSESGQNILTMRHDPYQQVYSAKWNADETLILSASDDRTARIWDAQTGELRVTMRHDEDAWVVGAAWNSDETLVLTWSYPQMVNIWDAATGIELFNFPHPPDVQDARWSPDDKRVITWSSRNIFRSWSVDLYDYIALAEARLLRPLNNEERQRFFLPTYTPTTTP